MLTVCRLLTYGTTATATDNFQSRVFVLAKQGELYFSNI
jgi:hypothetical protein